MPPAIEVRDARPVDAGALVSIWRQMSVGAGHQARLLSTPAEETARAAIARQADDPACRLVVGLCDGEVVAMAYLRRMAISPLHDEATVTVEYLHVMDAAR
ncbi:MAG: GNAT family N-acetyltransferase, partial [Nocardioidaceae bacterium]